MARRLLSAFIIASTLLAVEALPSARACDHTGWVYDPVDVPACVDVRRRRLLGALRTRFFVRH